MMLSRLLAVVIVVAAVLWIGSGLIGRAEPPAGETAKAEAPAAPPFRVAVVDAVPEMHARTLVLSGRTEADDRASAVARTAGSIVALKVRRGARVAEGDVIAVLSDEAREAQVAGAAAMLAMRRTDLDTKAGLIKRGIIAANEKRQLEADLRAAESALALAEAELERGQVRAPIAGLVSDVPVTTGQALQAGALVAEIVALDPMLAVVEVAERQLGRIREGDRAQVALVTGGKAEGAIRFISPSASQGTRTYRVDIELDPQAGDIPDGVTCQVSLTLAPAEAVTIPRSALTFSSEGQLSIRTVESGGTVATVPVALVEDGPEAIRVSGPTGPVRVIVQGQDFVTDGQRVEAVAAEAGPAAPNATPDVAPAAAIRS